MGILKQADFTARLEAAREIVKKNGLDAILVFSTECEPAQVPAGRPECREHDVGIAAPKYLLPFRGIKGWACETCWLVSVLAGWLVFPLAFDAIVIPN